MKKAVVSNRIFLHWSTEAFASITKALTYNIKSNSPNTPDIVFCDVKVVNDNIFSIPSGRIDLIPDDYEVTDKRSDVPYDFKVFKPTLFPKQERLLSKANGSCILNAPPGFGKTISAFALAKKLGQKTLVVAHTAILRDQWSKECESVFGFTPGYIGSGKVENIDTPVVIGNVQTVTKKIETIRALFGTMIMDECHHISAETFLHICNTSKAKHKIGLTGTLGRSDGKHIYIPDYMGGHTNIFRPSKAEDNRLIPKINIINTDIQMPGSLGIPWATRINSLFNKEDYVYTLITIIQAALKKNHKLLILASRIEFLEQIMKLFPSDVCKLIVGKTPQADRQIDFNRINLLFATTSIMKEGVNYPPLSALVMVDPISNVYLLEQIIGRIIRDSENKIQPEVYDIALTGNTGKNQIKERLSFYIQNDYEINHIQL